MEIRIASENDFKIIQDIAHKTWPSTFGEILTNSQITYMLDLFYNLDSLKKQTEESKNVFLIISEKSNDLGFISYELNYKNYQKTKIHKIYLLPESQGKGAGKILIEKVKKIAESNQNQALILNVNKYNKAISFYEKLGFKIVQSEKIDIGQGFIMDDYVMEMVVVKEFLLINLKTGSIFEITAF